MHFNVLGSFTAAQEPDILYLFFLSLTCRNTSYFLLLCPQVSVLSRACSDFLIGAMDLSNCLSLLSIAEAYGSASLLQSANHFVVQNFFELSKMPDFSYMQVMLETSIGFSYLSISYVSLRYLLVISCNLTNK